MMKTIYSNEYLTIFKVVNDRFIDSLPTQNRPAPRCVCSILCKTLQKYVHTFDFATKYITQFTGS